MRTGTLIRAAMAAAAQGRADQASRLLCGAAARTENERQRFALTERAYELALAS